MYIVKSRATTKKVKTKVSRYAKKWEKVNHIKCSIKIKNAERVKVKTKNKGNE